jgi:hypothetical protein
MTWRRALVWVLAAGAAVLSFDALRAYALGAPPLAGGVIPTRTIVDREWLAALWAIEIDAMAAAGILGARTDRKDWRAWSMFLLAAACSIGFQVLTLPAILARAVPPLALFLAIVVLELPRARPDWPPPPLPPDPVPQDEPEPEPVPVRAKVVRSDSTRANATTLDRARVADLLDQGLSASAIQRELGLSKRRYVADLLPLVRDLKGQDVPSTNGDRSGS